MSALEEIQKAGEGIRGRTCEVIHQLYCYFSMLLVKQLPGCNPICASTLRYLLPSPPF